MLVIFSVFFQMAAGAATYILIAGLPSDLIFSRNHTYAAPDRVNIKTRSDHSMAFVRARRLEHCFRTGCSEARGDASAARGGCDGDVKKPIRKALVQAGLPLWVAEEGDRDPWIGSRAGETGAGAFMAELAGRATGLIPQQRSAAVR